MTEKANQIRDKRRLWAAPGGSHDQRIRKLSRILPAAVGVIAAALFLGPLFSRGEISFLLDRTKVETTKDRVKVANAMYRGKDRDGRPFTVTAGNAVQESAKEPLIRMDRLAARLRLADGPAELTAEHGSYNYQTEQVRVTGPVKFTATDGYRLSTSDVAIDLKNRKVESSGRVSGAVPAGAFTADKVSADLDQRAVYLDGNVRLQFQQQALRIPQ